MPRAEFCLIQDPMPVLLQETEVPTFRLEAGWPVASSLGSLFFRFLWRDKGLVFPVSSAEVRCRLSSQTHCLCPGEVAWHVTLS